MLSLEDIIIDARIDFSSYDWYNLPFKPLFIPTEYSTTHILSYSTILNTLLYLDQWVNTENIPLMPTALEFLPSVLYFTTEQQGE